MDLHLSFDLSLTSSSPLVFSDSGGGVIVVDDDEQGINLSTGDSFHAHPPYIGITYSPVVFESPEVRNRSLPHLPDHHVSSYRESDRYMSLMDCPPATPREELRAHVPVIDLEEEDNQRPLHPPGFPMHSRRRRTRPSASNNNAQRFNLGELQGLQGDITRFDLDFIKRKPRSGFDSAIKEEEEEGAKKGNDHVNFECNICFDIAKDPVVTSCGHLFCWPCLYQWLHVHSQHRECPVCKGALTDNNITPIYGRGCAGAGVEEKGRDPVSALKIPPRPPGNRLESMVQRFPPSEIGLMSLERIMQLFPSTEPGAMRERVTNLARTGATRHVGSSIPGRISAFSNFGGGTSTNFYGRTSAFNRIESNPPRTRTRRIQGEEGNHRNHILENNPLVHHRANLMNSFRAFCDTTGNPYAVINAEFNRAVAGHGGTSQHPTTPPVTPVVLEPQPLWPIGGSTLGGAEAPTSSTMAVIEGEFARASGSADPNSTGSSSSIRRRGRRGSIYTPQGADVDDLHRHKRRHT